MRVAQVVPGSAEADSRCPGTGRGGEAAEADGECSGTGRGGGADGELGDGAVKAVRGKAETKGGRVLALGSMG